MKIDTDILGAFSIAVFVSCLFYYLHTKPGIVITRLDYGYLIGGSVLPYVLPSWIVFKKKMEVLKNE